LGFYFKPLFLNSSLIKVTEPTVFQFSKGERKVYWPLREFERKVGLRGLALSTRRDFQRVPKRRLGYQGLKQRSGSPGLFKRKATII